MSTLSDQREPSCSARIDDIRRQFESAWKRRPYPRIGDFLPDESTESDRTVLRELLVLLVKLDLELRWELAARAHPSIDSTREQADDPLPLRPRLADYVARFPGLNQPHGLPRKLIVHEYYARCRWGDAPGHQEYLAAYGERHPGLGQSLEKADGELNSSQQKPNPDVPLTLELQLPKAESLPEELPEQLPETIARYRIKRRLGKGGFAIVYLAHDPDLNRPVALKVPRRDRFDSEADLDRFVDEARKAAQLEHPRIVRIHDVQREPGSVYVVQQYIDGQDLAKYAKSNRLASQQAAELMIGIAEPVGFAHQRGFVHRDLKPANILVNSLGEAHVADFGLALHAAEQRQHRDEIAGTCAYMSPEQVRGEAHRLDGRSDIWSLGVILYELLTGCRPFAGENHLELFDEIEYREPRPLREIDPEVPRELARICVTCLAKRKTERYQTTADLIDDLRHWLQGKRLRTAAVDEQHPTPDTSAPVKIVPKGLRSFDAGDADFFLQLLPGPRDRDGLPTSIRFWKTQIEEPDPEATFTVGVMYGPSGCGKSSLLKAGLLPRLSEDVLPLYVEATAADTELRLLKTLRKRCPEMSAGASLSEVFAQVRTDRGLRGRKVLVVLDQFEQWLHACPDYAGSQLVRALRQCDGAGAQALVLVRADFWMSVTRFMQALEIPLVEGHNSAAVDLFDPDHARRVLAAFGDAYGRLGAEPKKGTGPICRNGPEGAAHKLDLSPFSGAEQARFFDLAVQGLAQDGKVICVRLAIFAEMMKGRPWTEASLREVGGAEGVGVTFLDESFSAHTAPPSHRQHQPAARAVLKELLPEHGTDIKGQMKAYDQLREASGYAKRPADFNSLLGILDHELRLITPTDPEKTAAGEEDAAAAPDEKYYQLTHDYLTPSLREWLTREQKKTRRGRAELRLAERAALWNAKPENRHLPSWWEYLSIRLLAREKNWTAAQGKMMRTAGRVHLIRAAMALTLLVVASIAAVKVRQRVVEQQDLTRAQGLVDALVKADTLQVPELVKQLDEYAAWSEPRLAEKLAHAADGSPEKLHLSVALAGKDDAQVEYLYGQLLRAEANRFPVIRNALAGQRQRLSNRLWAVLAGRETDPDQQRLRAAGALAAYDPRNPEWLHVAPEVAAQLVAVNPVFVGQWQEVLRPVSDRLLPPLAKIFRDPGQGELPRSLATMLLASYAKDDPQMLTDLIVDADAKAFATLFPILEKHRQTAVEKLQAVLARQVEATLNDPPLDSSRAAPPAADAVVTIDGTIRVGADLSAADQAEIDGPSAASPQSLVSDRPLVADADKEQLAQRKANAASALLRMNVPAAVWPLLQHPPDPRLQTWLIHRMRPLGVDAEMLVKQLLDEKDVSIRRALILSLGESEAKDSGVAAEQPAKAAVNGRAENGSRPPPAMERLVSTLRDLYRNDPDPGIHAAAEWLLRRWGQADELRKIDSELATGKIEGGRQWYVNAQGQTLVVIRGPVEFEMGSPAGEEGRSSDETLHRRQIGRSYAIATKEVTVEQYKRFAPDFGHDQMHRCPEPNCPILGVTWYEAAKYCNWLSEREGLTGDQRCYVPNASGQFAVGMKLAPNWLERTGYRLPTEGEWEYACRAGAGTRWSYGQARDLLGTYAWYVENSNERTWPVGQLRPNGLGLFDMHGNVFEWCQDWNQSYGKSGLRADDGATAGGEGSSRSIRGGDWGNWAWFCRSALRIRYSPSLRNDYLGFRVARSLSGK